MRFLLFVRMPRASSSLDKPFLITMDSDSFIDRKVPDYASLGLIEEISLKNFMCHTELNIDNLSRNKISFITGPNGAGKSAVLTSLMLGFGGRANITCRGHTTKGFVKEGKTHADIQIKLRNDTTFGSFQPEKFGNFIVIRRRLHPNGSSEYLLSSDKMVPIYKTASALKKLLSFFDIRVENPLLLLTQENAKKLLFDASEKDMYKFFRAGTGLDDILQRIGNLRREVERVRNNWVVRKDVFEKRKKDLVHLERRYERYRQVEDLQNKERELKQNLEWFDLVQKERELAGVKDQADRIGKQKTDLEKKKDVAQRCIEDIQASVTEQAEAVKEAAAAIDKAKADVQAAQSRQKEVMVDVKKVEGELQFRQKKLTQLNSQKNEVVRAIDAAERKLRAKQGADAERQRNEARLAELRSQKTELEKSLIHETSGRDEAVRRLTEARQAEQRLRETDFALRRDVDQLAKQRSSYESVQTNSASRFGKMMPAILREVEDAQRRGAFKRQPIGPLGRYVSLVGDESWAPAVEGALGKNYAVFVVSCQADKNVFHDIMRNKLHIMPSSNDYPKIVSSDRALGNGRIDISRSKASCPNSDLMSFFDLAEITDDDAFNFLVELAGIETKLFAGDSLAALDLVNSGRCQRTHEVIAKNLDRIVIQFHSKGSNFYSNTYPVRTNYLMKNVEKQMADVRQQETEAKARYQEVKPQLEAASREVAGADAAVRRIESAAARVNEKMRAIDNEVERISRLNASVLEEPNDVMLLQEDLQRKVAEIDAYESSQETTVLNARLKAATDQRRAADKLFEEARAVLARAEQAHEAAEEHAGQIHRSVADARRKLPGLREQYDKVNDQWNALRTRIEESEAACQELLDSLLERYGNRPRHRSNESRRDIEESLKDLREKIADRERIDRSGFDSIPERQEMLKKEDRELKERDIQIQTLETMINRRVEGFPRMVSTTARKVENWFSKMSYTKDLNSQLKFDHDNATLAFRVSSMPVANPAKQRRVSSALSEASSSEVSLTSRPTTPTASSSATSRSIRTLSGGERSMSTVFFLLALWEQSESPIKGMDEFDVFLDGENRQRAIGLIVKFSPTMSGQFFLLSPCNISTLGGPTSRNQIIELRKGGGLRGANDTLSQTTLNSTCNKSRNKSRLTQSQQPSASRGTQNDEEEEEEEVTIVRPRKRRCKMEPTNEECDD